LDNGCELKHGAASQAEIATGAADLRAFADKDLKLPWTIHYRKDVMYTGIRSWNCEAARNFRWNKGWWYPARGAPGSIGATFQNDAAPHYGDETLHKKAAAGSSWRERLFDARLVQDTVLNTFYRRFRNPIWTRRFLMTRHQRVFARGDTDFNEAFETTFGRKAARAGCA